MLHLPDLNFRLPEESWVTVGTFDGVHQGHQALIKKMVESANAAKKKAIVVTFHPHPSVVLGKRQGNINLTTPQERAEYLEEIGIDILVDQVFDRLFASTPAQEYVYKLQQALSMRQLWVGHDFALGRDREGDIPSLRQFGTELGFKVIEVSAMKTDHEVISSSKIRELLWLGDVQAAGHLLGRPYSLAGIVVSGDQRGRTIGFPTANIDVDDEKLVPAQGVYACLARLNHQMFAAATNIGVRPTFDGSDVKVHVETHLLDFSGDLYNQTLSLEFIQRLRGEKKFSGVAELVEQITKDVGTTRVISSTLLATQRAQKL